MVPLPKLPRELDTSHVLIRFVLRVIVLAAFAMLGGMGFGRSLATLLWMSIVLCTTVGAVKREPVFGAALNHWDEAVACAALVSLVGALNHPFSV